jgi:ketosteroid isomerase-like protein
MDATRERRRPGIETLGAGRPRTAIRLLLAAWAVLAVAASPAPGLALLRVSPPLIHHEDRLHKQIEGLESQWRDAILTNNVAVLDHLLADDYLGITANGTLETKADALAIRRSGTVKISSLQPKDTKIHVYGDTAVVTSRVDLTGTSGDRDISGLYHYTRVYNLRDGQWKVVSFEASRLPDKGRR